MDFLKELFGGEGSEDQDVNCLLGGTESEGGAIQPRVTGDLVKIPVSGLGATHLRSGEVLSHPLPLLPADSQNQSTVISQKCASFDSSIATASPSCSTSREHVDINDVPLEMPIYLLAEDEGNEEEILRLLESESPGGSPSTEDLASTHQEREQPIEEGDSQSASPTPSSSTQSSSPKETRPASSISELQMDVEVKASSEAPPVIITEKRQSGGWPKGKSRKKAAELLLPKPPVSGYSLFTLEHRSSVEQECNTKSMPVLSKTLGKMWSELTMEQKNVYNDRARIDRERYFQELDRYLAEIYQGANLEKARNHISVGFSGENDGNLACSVCDLTFVSSYSKHSHYSGKLHLKALLQNIESDIRAGSELKSHSYTGPAISSCLKMVAADYEYCLEKCSCLSSKIKTDLERNALLQQEYEERENQVQ